MTTFKHTPGPWNLVTNDGKFSIQNYEQDVEVCSGWLQGEGEANARLIAAAPELLEALILARRYMLKDYPEEAGPYILPMYMEQDLRRIDAAIAKAEGGAL